MLFLTKEHSQGAEAISVIIHCIHHLPPHWLKLTVRRIPVVIAPITFRFSRLKGPLLLGSHYFRMVKTRLCGAVIHSAVSEIGGRITLLTTHINEADCIFSFQLLLTLV